jgi:predicted N-formylglutamate amidohydrolase
MTDLPYRLVNEDGPAPMVIVCDHASNRVPAGYGDLGLPPAELARHIAWDIGAAAISEILARRTLRPASPAAERVARRNVTFSPRGGTRVIA